ncbi:hypothetical protein [Endozoicomonas elysicola]|uniref:Phospholipase n=1 Tax=Endozoicomonas elysicola TaxID=305900 RepID=A0A081KG01_9GAMM|nr:hypothetical protein [Endozoicomonas elysicola]KEI73077.1 hypothetical protein GV64_22300 [Endozoicomonas elysicola]
MRIFYFAVSLMLSAQVSAWSNHTLVTHQLVATLPQVRDAAPVEVESLNSFLLANESELEVFLSQQESWMRENLWHYAPRPEALEFRAKDKENDIRTRFTHAIRINPNAKLPLYLQLLPGDKRQQPEIDFALVSTLADSDSQGDVQFVQLMPEDKVAPLDVVSTASVEPDYGLDIGLFTDSNTDYGKVYGFGEQPFGNPNLEYGTQAPFHMGFYHESPIVYAFGGFLKRTYPEYRIQLYKQLSEFAFAQGHDYWGWRFMGWGLHYIGDFSNPYHVMPVPGNSTMETLRVGLLNMLDFPDAQNNAIQLASNRHTVLENFQSLVMTQAYLEQNLEHPTIQALTRHDEAREFNNDHIVTVMSQHSYDMGHDIHDVLERTMPEKYVDDPSVEYSDLNARASLQETVLNTSGEDGFNALVHIITDLLGGFSDNGASYVEAILSKQSSVSSQPEPQVAN